MQATELRFKFGKNWKNYINTLSDTNEAILQAEISLKKMLGLNSLEGKKFLDIGCGSGLFSLTARKLGAEVFSFDYDMDSVECTKNLKNKFYPNDTLWLIEKGDVLSKEYINSLGKFDIIYSWGVLHHTGNMHEALNNALIPIKEDGLLFISIYNDQGRASVRWKFIKRIYNKMPKYLKFIPTLYTLLRQWTLTILRDTVKFANPLRTWQKYSEQRGMSAWYDVIDWVGGYPFEVAKPEEIFNFYTARGLKLLQLKTCAGGHGCNEFVFKKSNTLNG